MYAALFVYHLHPAKLAILVRAKVDEKRVIKTLRAASYNRRTLVRTNPRAWFSYLVGEVRKISKFCEIGNDIPTPPEGMQVSIYATRDKLGVSVIPVHLGILQEPLYDGSFYAFLGRSEPVRFGKDGQPLHPGPRLSRRARLDFFRENYKKQHGYYPHEATPNSPKRYNPLQQKLIAEEKRRRKRFENRSEGQKKRQEDRLERRRFHVKFEG